MCVCVCVCVNEEKERIGRQTQMRGDAEYLDADSGADRAVQGSAAHGRTRANVLDASDCGFRIRIEADAEADD